MRWRRKGKKAAKPKGAPELTPTLNEGLARLGLADDPAIKSFFGGALADYIKTPRGKDDIHRVVTDPEQFEYYMQALRIEGATDLMIDFLKTKEGVDSYVSVCETKEGLRLMIKIGQTDEGREVGLRMVKGPSCWPSVIRIIKGIRDLNPVIDDEEEPGPSFDFSQYRDSADGIKRLVPLLRDRDEIHDIFISLSQSREDAKFCGRLLEDDEARQIIFDYITGNRDRVMDVFNTLFRSKDRRSRISGVFASKGGTQLLADLAADKTGKEMLTELVLNANGMNVGWKALLKGSLRRPILLIKVGKAYFQKPKTGHTVVEHILSAALRFFASFFP